MKTFYQCEKEKPDTVDSDTMVIEPLDFLEEVKACGKYKPVTGLIALNYLRTIAAEVGRKYDKDFNPWRHVVPTDYIGIKFKKDEDVAKIVKKMFDSKYPKIYEAYFRSKIISRSFHCKNIILIGDERELVDIAESCGLEPKKDESIQDNPFLEELVEAEKAKVLSNKNLKKTSKKLK